MAMNGRMKEYRYYLSSSVNANILIRLSLVELSPPDMDGKGAPKTIEELTQPVQSLRLAANQTDHLRNTSLSEIFVTAQIFSDGLALHPMLISSQAPYKCSETTIYWKDEWLNFPVRYRDLSRRSVVALTIWGVGWVPLAGTTLPFFSKHGLLRDGLQCLRLWDGVEADPSSTDSTTPFEVDDEWSYDESYRLDKLREKYERKQIPRNEWMDGVTDRRIGRIRRGSEPPGKGEAYAPFCTYRQDPLLWLELPYFGDTVVYEEEPYSQRTLSSYNSEPGQKRQTAYGSSSSLSTSTNAMQVGHSDEPTPSTPTPLVTARSAPKDSQESSKSKPLICVWDPELNEDNPAERKYRKLARDILRGSIDPNLKPSRDEKAKIETLLATPTDILRNEDKDLLWKFRYTLTDNKKAVIKFLLSVDWKEEPEVNQTTELLQQWCEIDIADALRLLGREKEFKHEAVRNFAVSTLSKASNDELLDFLLQLVQALRYEKPGSVASNANSRPMNGGDEPSGDEPVWQDQLGPLARFLIQRSSTNFQMANYVYWYLKVESQDFQRDESVFRLVLDRMLEELRSDEEKKPIYDMLMAQREFLERLLAFHNKAREDKGKKDKKEEKLKQYLKQFPWGKNVIIRLPLDPTVHLSGIVASSAKMFKSAMYPAVIQFQTVQPPQEAAQDEEAAREPNTNSSQHGNPLSQSTLFNMNESALLRESLSSRMIHYLNREKEGPPYKVMVKNGDDLRQDQLIMQMFILMDRLLKKVNLDLQLTPYRILATGTNDGMMEFVQHSFPMSYVVEKFPQPQVLNFLRKHNPDASSRDNVSTEAMNTYVKSTAGYCVVTYLLGIGDRHLDNLMMKSDGHLFHIDFGFIFGADPKPYPPPFRLTREMVEGMGGVDSEHYLKFITYCCQAYNWLRKSADLILNLLSLMADAGIEELSTDPKTTLQKVQERFRLDLTDEQAEHFFLSLIYDSSTAKAPVLMDMLHKLATNLK